MRRVKRKQNLFPSLSPSSSPKKEKDKKDKKHKSDEKSGKRKADTVLDTQKKVAAEKARVHATAIAGRPVPYVDAQGFLMKEVSAGVKRRRDSEAAQVVRDEVSASRPAKIRKLYAGPGASLVTSTRFETVDHFKAADAVVVDNLAARTRDDAVLCASLWGKALCDNEWVKSGGERGTCFQYVKCGGKDRPPLQLYLSEAFSESSSVGK